MSDKPSEPVTAQPGKPPGAVERMESCASNRLRVTHIMQIRRGDQNVGIRRCQRSTNFHRPASDALGVRPTATQGSEKPLRLHPGPLAAPHATTLRLS